ncbi:hypothetical protein L1987_33881 [Smallanthus sonchifolius]|uniref:Uncharacterized protein n=1 Tax=Smallanthus sonchifolius TaxID=185202 RepID=A0ACB9HSB2_9ASTR|nr:hypothetical protein L1987_33881 [Smallanthus sonchifolius]
MIAYHIHRFCVDVQKQEKATLEDAQAIMHSTARDVLQGHINRSKIYSKLAYHCERFGLYASLENSSSIECQSVLETVTVSPLAVDIQ